mgnify:CR=1 FL=1
MMYSALSTGTWPTRKAIIWSLMLFMIGSNTLWAQQESDMSNKKTLPIAVVSDIDTFQLAGDSVKLLNKLLQLHKFKKNRDLKERQRFYSFINELLQKNPGLNLDEATVSQLLDTLEKTGLDEVECKLGHEGSKIVINRNILALLATDQVDSVVINDTLVKYYTTRLTPKIKIVGRYEPAKEAASEDYNFDYLSALNCYGYALSPTGHYRSTGFMDEFWTSGILDDASMNGVDLYLTVYNEQPAEIAAFLRDLSAQQEFLLQLSTLLSRTSMRGIIFDFDGIAIGDKLVLVSFIKTVREQLSLMDSTMALLLTIPAIMDETSLEKSGAFDFMALDPLVDHYIVQTQGMPLFKNSASRTAPGTVEATINYYSDGKVPISKILLTVSWADHSDPDRLTEQYNWAMEKDLGGISLVDIGSTTHNKDLWGQLGNALMTMDTIFVAKKSKPLDKVDIRAEQQWSVPLLFSVWFLGFGLIYMLWKYYRHL